MDIKEVDGRKTVDELATGRDLLLERLREVHGRKDDDDLNEQHERKN